MAPFRPVMHDPESLAGRSPFLSQGSAHATTTVSKTYTPVNAHNTSGASQLASVGNDAELTPFRPQNPVASQLADVRNDTESTLFRPTHRFAAQLADVRNDAELTLSRPPNPFRDETYPASAGSSIRSKAPNASHSFGTESRDLSFSSSNQVVHDSQARTYNRSFSTVPALFSVDDRQGASSEQPNILEHGKNLSSSPALGASESNPSVLPNHRQTKGGWTRVYNHAAKSTLPEGSTIDNILRQYKGSDVESMNTGIRPDSSLHRNLSQLTDESSFLSGQNDLQGQSQRSYGLRIPPTRKTCLPRSTAETDIASIATAPPTRVPLEQAVKMLRCHSDDSLKSNAYSTVHGGRQLHPSPKPRQEQFSRQVSEPVSIDEETKCLARTALVYNQVSMDPAWNVEENNVRAPAPAHVRSRPAQPELYDESEVTTNRADRDEDWFTVDSDDGPPDRCVSSSIGTVSTLEGINCVDVPERVVQHPAAVHYEGSYRPLNLKNYKVPVMAPSKGPYRINGFPADSLRSKPQLNHYQQPSPLRIHKNPFTGQAPKIPHSSGDPRGPISKYAYAASSSTLSTGKTFSAAQSESTLPKPKRWDDNDPILSTMNSIPTIHPDHMAHSRRHNRQPENGTGTATFAKPIGYQQYDFSSTIDASGNKLYHGQARGMRAPAYTGEGRPKVTRMRRLHPKRKPAQFDGPNPYSHSDAVSSEASLLHTHRAQKDALHPIQKTAPSPNPRRKQHTFTIEEPRFPITERHTRQENIFLTVVILCNLCPPLLAFLWLGKLDNIIGWWTRWEHHEFSKRGKNIAGILSAIWLAATLIALIVVLFVHLALYLKGRHH